VRETTFTDDTYIVTEKMTDADILQAQKDLMNAAQKKLNEICKLSYTITIDAINFMAIPQFRKYADQLQLGNIITIEVDEDNIIEARLLKIHINWDKPNDFELTFSSKNKLDGGWSDFADVVAQNTKATTANNINGSGWDLAKMKAPTFSDYMNSALDASLQKIKNGKDETFEITGMYGKSFNLGWKDFYDPEIKPITTSKYKVIAVDFDGNEISYLYEDFDGDPALDRIERHMRNHCQSYRIIPIPEHLKVYSKQSPDFIDLV
jgi:hypothetical protein